jgi:UDP-N-acetylglucosamine acyltransferase
MIHPTAVIHPNAKLDPSVTVGPHAVIDADVVLGPGCRVGPSAYLTGHMTAGANNAFHACCVIGDAPQDFKYKGEPTRLRIGDNNVFREHVTVHCSNKLEEDTVIGSNNLLMVHCHVGHNVVIGNHVILANGSLLSGHVTVADRAFISGNCMVHQFTRVGTLALMQAGSAISKDLPPFCIARGDNGIAGLNIIGLRRAGFTPEQRLSLKRAYHLLFRSGQRMKERVAGARARFSEDSHVKEMVEFVSGSKRGVCADTGRKASQVEVDE